jgi:hypothetical protein
MIAVPQNSSNIPIHFPISVPNVSYFHHTRCQTCQPFTLLLHAMTQIISNEYLVDTYSTNSLLCCPGGTSQELAKCVEWGVSRACLYGFRILAAGVRVVGFPLVPMLLLRVFLGQLHRDCSRQLCA